MDLHISNNRNTVIFFSEWGASITRWDTLDKDGRKINIVLGYDNEKNYMDNPFYLGATAGRYANRIKNGQFQLGDESIQLKTNDNGHHLHGGPKGFSSQKWSVKKISDSKIIFNLRSPDKDQGYPGDINVKTIYELNKDNELSIYYECIANQDTIVNLTHHSYFNLSGENSDNILNHLLFINAENYTEINSDLIPTGKIVSVNNTPLDFRKPIKIGKRISNNFKQLIYAQGYDHNFVINIDDDQKLNLAAILYSKSSGLEMSVKTNLPGLQFYSGNFLDGNYNDIYGKPLSKHRGLCLEPQFFPDSPNKINFPSPILKKGDVYDYMIKYGLNIK
tara:strand:- start:340 stop:1341 length:1002 start_codon:yes stop_codon:yes gene_type:complete